MWFNRFLAVIKFLQKTSRVVRNPNDKKNIFGEEHADRNAGKVRYTSNRKLHMENFEGKKACMNCRREGFKGLLTCMYCGAPELAQRLQDQDKNLHNRCTFSSP